MRGEMQLTNETILLDVEASDTNDNVKTKIQRNINTKHNMKPNNDDTLGEHVNVRVVVLVFLVCLAVVTLIPCTHRLAQDVRVFVSFHPMVIAMHA